MYLTDVENDHTSSIRHRENNSSNMKIEPVENKPSKPYIDSKSIFRPVLFVGRILGLFKWDVSSTENRCSLKKFLSLCHFVFVQIIVWGIVLKYAFVVYKDRNSGRLIPILAVVSFHAGSAYVPTLTYFSSHKCFGQLFKLLNDYQTQFEPFQKMSSLKKHAKQNIISTLFSGIIGAAIFCYLVSVPFKKDMENLMYPFTFSGVEDSVWAYMFLGLSELFSLTHVDIMFFLASQLSFLLVAEFKHITKKLQNEIEKFNNIETKDVIYFEQFLEKTRHQHILLVEILEATNSVLKHYIFAFFAVAIPIICFVLYGVIRNYLALGEMIFCLLMAHSFIIVVSVFSIIGAYLNIKAHEPLDVLMSIDVSSVSNKTYRTISMFVSTLTGTNIGYRVYDLLTIDASAILTLIGTFVTYGVVMLQFTGYDIPNVECLGNGTFTL